MKLARGTAAATLHHSGLVGVSRGRNGISELRTCATAQIRFSSLPRPSLLTSECVCVFGGSIQFQRKPKVVVSYTSRARVPTLPTPPAVAIVPFVGSSSQAARKSHAVPLMTFFPHSPAVKRVR